MEVLVSVIIKEKEIKVIQIGKKELRLSLFTDNMLPYTENPKDATKNPLEFIYKHEKVPGLKINVDKSVAFLYTNKEKSKKKKEIKKIIPLQSHQNEKNTRNKSF